VPEAVGDAKWQEMYETYVADRDDLQIRERFRQADNLLAYQALVDKMLVAINKGYWQASDEVKAHLERVNREVIQEAGVACDANSCSSVEITRLAEAQDRQAMEAARQQPAPDTGTAATAADPAGATRPADTPKQADTGSSSKPATPALPATRRSSATDEKTDQTEGEKVSGYRVERQDSNRNPAAPPDLPWTPLLLAGLVLLGFLLSGRRGTT